MAFYSALAESIDAYTGLSPVAFFTIVALMVGVYFLVSGFFVYPEDEAASKSSPPPPQQQAPPPEPFVPPEPVQVGDITLEELQAYNGSDPKKPLLMAIKGQVYDVSIGRLFYGPGGAYSFFAGRETSRALALMSFDPRDLNSDLEDLNEAELEVLHDWEEKFKEKYVKVGQIVSEKSKDGNEDENSKQIKENLE
ncbi:putative steroid-binding protein 3 [Canna indica]|uniref:Steroid-binding protein 3 n=1 Tax=Canna indica TaxID=4628 RepID=A0AAQ3QMI6_9LILI|nr:putative steroid-binding protein 3 [Canna indica]